MMSDEQLVEQVAQGHEGSLEALVYRYHKPINAYLQRMLGDATLAEDLTQECFVRLCQAVQTKQLPTRFRPWLYRIASNLCKDVWKSAAYRRELLSDHDKLSLHSAQDTVSSILERQWEREAIIRALQLLKPEEKQLIILRFYQDLKLQDISDIVDLPLSTVKSRLYQTYKKLAHHMAKEESMSDGQRQSYTFK